MKKNEKEKKEEKKKNNKYKILCTYFFTIKYSKIKLKIKLIISYRSLTPKINLIYIIKLNNK